MKKDLKRLLAMALLLTALLSACAGKSDADIPSPTSSFYVYDGANVLAESTEKDVVAKNRSLSALTGAQIVVVTVETTGDRDIADYAHALFNAWKIGDREKNNGVLLLLSIEEDDYWALQGEGIEDLLSSGVLKLMLNADLEPDFAVKRYDSGVRKIFASLISFFETAYGVTVEAETGEEGESAVSETSPAESETGGMIPSRPESGERDTSPAGTEAEEKGFSFFGFVKTVIKVVLIAAAVLIVLLILIVIIAAIAYRPRNPVEIPRSHTTFRNPHSSSFRRSFGGSGPPPPPPHFGNFGGFGGTARRSSSRSSFGSFFGGSSGGGGSSRRSGGSRPSGGFRPSGGSFRGGGGRSRGGGAGRR